MGKRGFNVKNYFIMSCNTTYLSKAVSISLSISSVSSIPAFFISMGYILIDVKPGIVFISLKTISPLSLFTKKSTLDNPWQSSRSNMRIALSVSFLFKSSLIFGYAVVFTALLLYLSSNV